MTFAGLPKYMAGVARFAYETGARAGEILKLKWGYLGQGAISVPASDTKNRTARSIVLTPQLESIIENQRTMRVDRCELIFHNAGDAIRDYRKCWRTVCVLNGFGQWYCRSCRDADFNYISVLDAKRVCPKCGQKWGGKKRTPKYVGKIFHDFRRSCAYELWKAGNTVEDCMEVTGHLTEAMFKRYADLFSDEEKQARQRESQQRRSEWQAEQNKSVPPAVTPASRGMVQ
jgi:integrase